MESHLNSVLKACENMIREGSTTFYRAFGFLPSPRREAVYVIYAFCRMIDDAMDEPEKSPYTLDELVQLFDHLEDAEGHFIWPALRWLFERFPLSKEPFYEQIAGQRMDEILTHYDTMEQLETYCYHVAGTVGEMLLPVLHDCPDASIVQSGIWLGKAMQIVNIVRDVGEDQGKGRRYIPLDLMARHGYSEAEWRAGLVNDSWISLVQELSVLAREWFERGMENLDSYPAVSGFCVAMAARMYEGILDDVKHHHYNVYTRRAYVTGLRKMAILKRLAVQHGMTALLKDNQESSAVS